MSTTFDLSVVEEKDAGSIRVDESTVWNLRNELVYSASVKIRRAGRELVALADDEDADPIQFVRLVGQIVEAACVDADDAAERLVALFEADQIGLNRIRGLAEFLGEWAGVQSDPKE